MVHLVVFIPRTTWHRVVPRTRVVGIYKEIALFREHHTESCLFNGRDDCMLQSGSHASGHILAQVIDSRSSPGRASEQTRQALIIKYLDLYGRALSLFTRNNGRATCVKAAFYARSIHGRNQPCGP